MNTNSHADDDSSGGNEAPVHFDIRHLSTDELAQLGMAQIAYV